MNRKTKILVVTGASAITISSGMLTSRAFAQSTTGGKSLASEIATKFHLNQDEVQKTIDQHNQEMQANRMQAFQNKLDQAVLDGKLTSAQRSEIEAKETEVQAKMQTIKAMTDATTRKTAMQQLQTDLKGWADENKIDTEWLRELGGPRGPIGRHNMTKWSGSTAEKVTTN